MYVLIVGGGLQRREYKVEWLVVVLLVQLLQPAKGVVRVFLFVLEHLCALTDLFYISLQQRADVGAHYAAGTLMQVRVGHVYIVRRLVQECRRGQWYLCERAYLVAQGVYPFICQGALQPVVFMQYALGSRVTAMLIWLVSIVLLVTGYQEEDGGEKIEG